MKYYVDEQYFKLGPTLFRDADQALANYGRVLSGSDTLETFLTRHGRPGLKAEDRRTAYRLLVMQRCSLASFSSCAWFFDDIARIEPLNGLTHARRALDLLLATGGPDVEASSNASCTRPSPTSTRTGMGSSFSGPRFVQRPSLPTLARLASADGERAWPGHLRLTVGDGVAHGFWTQTLDEETRLWTDRAR